MARQFRWYIAVEGNSGIGKTTTASLLAERTGQQAVLEYHYFVDAARGEALPRFPPASVEEVIETNVLWPRIDLQREARRMALPPGRVAFQVVDTTPLSVFGYEFAKAAQGLPHAIADLATRYWTLYRDGRLTEPGGWVLLMAGTRTVLSRIADKGGTREFLTRRSTIEYMNRFRLSFLAEYVPNARSLVIHNDDAGIDAVAEQALRFASGLGASIEGCAVRRFLADLLEDRDAIPRVARV
jgi:hypothetical protein